MPVLVPDLRTSRQQLRWPAYTPAALERGAQAVFAFPLQVGAVRLGVLEADRAAAASLSPDELTLALTFAEVTVEALLDGQARNGHEGTPPGLDSALARSAVVYQAQGMLMVDLAIPLADALVRLRTYAFVTDRPIDDVARDIVTGDLQLEADP